MIIDLNKIIKFKKLKHIPLRTKLLKIIVKLFLFPLFISLSSYLILNDIFIVEFSILYLSYIISINIFLFLDNLNSGYLHYRILSYFFNNNRIKELPFLMENYIDDIVDLNVQSKEFYNVFELMNKIQNEETLSLIDCLSDEINKSKVLINKGRINFNDYPSYQKMLKIYNNY